MKALKLLPILAVLLAASCGGNLGRLVDKAPHNAQFRFTKSEYCTPQNAKHVLAKLRRQAVAKGATDVIVDVAPARVWVRRVGPITGRCVTVVGYKDHYSSQRTNVIRYLEAEPGTVDVGGEKLPLVHDRDMIFRRRVVVRAIKKGQL